MMTQNEIKALMDSIALSKKGIRFDISGTNSAEQTVKVKEDESLNQSAAQRSSATLRVWNFEGRVGVVQLTSLDKKELLKALDVALQAAEFGLADEAPSLPSVADAGDLPSHKSLAQKNTPASMETLSEDLLSSVKQIKRSHGAITGVPYNGLTQRTLSRFYANSEGLIRSQGGQSLSAYLYARGQIEGHKPRAAGHWGEGNVLSELKLSEVARKASEKLVSHLHPIKIPSGQYPVVFSGSAFLDLLDAFSNLFSAQNILDNQSLHTKDHLGQQVASSLLSITDDPLHDAHVNPALFDGEGTAVRKTLLVEHGVLKDLWHHSVTAKIFSTQKTGHARVGAKMTVGPWFYNVSTGQGLGEIVNRCIWIEELEALHAGVNSLQGSFSLPFLGYWMENGKKQSLEGVTVAGDFLSLLNSIHAVDSKQEHTPGGVCPAIAVGSLSITCEASQS